MGDTRPSPPEQYESISKLEKEVSVLKEGDSWYVIPSAWWETWEEQCISGGPEPGPIDLTPILDIETKTLNKDARENDDFVLRHSKIWKKLYGWYGVARSSLRSSVKGEVVAAKTKSSSKPELIIELFPMEFKFFVPGTVSSETAVSVSPGSLTRGSRRSSSLSKRNSKTNTISVSKYVEMRSLSTAVSKKLGFKGDGTDRRVWLKTESDPETSWKLVRADDEQTVNEDLPTSETWCLLLEEKSGDGTWPREGLLEDDGGIDETELVRAHAPSIDMSNPESGQMLDVQRKKDDNWYEARVENCARRDSGTWELTVHYLSFDHKFDETLSIDSPRIAKHHTHVRDWRTQLKVEEEVEVHKKLLGNKWVSKSTWQVAKVRKFDRDDSNGKHPGGRVLLRVKQGLNVMRNFKEVWVPLRSELLAQRHTHIARVKPSWGPSATSGKPAVSGVVGLRNLGNTCFMNSMLQCLSATQPLANFFLQGAFRKDLNRKNPLGAGGQLAESFAELVKQMHSDRYSVAVPTDFKRVLGAHFSQFAGYQQQDSHELFSVLLDGLHEDLNRVLDKPATEAVEGKGRPDHLVAQEAWDVFRLRNDSVVVDRMMGLMRSHLTCPTCDTQAVKFDAYSNWSVPVPSMEDKSVDLVFFRLEEVPAAPDASAYDSGPPKALTPLLRRLRPERYTVSVPRRGTGRSLAQWLSKRSGVATTDIVVLELFNNKGFSYYFSPSVDKPVRSIKDGETIVAYELLPAVELRTWRNCSRKGIRSSRSGAPVSSASPAFFAIAELSESVWDELVDMYLAMALPESVADAWWRSCCVDADVEESQRAIVAKLRSQRLPGAAKRTQYQAKVARALAAKVVAKNRAVAEPLRNWVEYERGEGGGPAPEGGKRAPPSPAVLLRSPSGGSFKRGSVSAGGVIPVEVVHKYKEGYSYSRPFRAPDIVSFLPDASWNEIHQTVWRHVKWMFRADYNPPEAWLARFGCETGEASLSDHIAAAATSALGAVGAALAQVEPPYELRRDNSFSSKSLPFGTEPSELSNDTLVLEWTRTGVHALVHPPASLQVAAPAEPEPEAPKKRRPRGRKPPQAAPPGEWEEADRALNVGKVRPDETVLDGSGAGAKAAHLSHCLEKFRQREQLGENDEWYCPSCKTLVQAFKKMDIWSVPDILVVHLKRFLYERSRFRTTVHREKITDHIAFPLTGLDVRDFVFDPDNDSLSAGRRVPKDKSKQDPRYVYDLYAVSNHIGSMGGGHYTAYVLNPSDGNWYNMDDSRTSKIDEDQVCSNKAYVLFYKRRSLK